MKLRPPAVPLITVDPYFSIWSFSDKLSSDVTRHWTGQRSAMLGFIRIDGEVFCFMGKTLPSNEKYFCEPPEIPQVSVDIKAMTTTYVFENEKVIFTLNFLTPLILDDFSLLSRPASYLYYDIMAKDEKKHDFEVYFEISGEACVDKPTQRVVFTKKAGHAFCGNEEQNILNKSGDDLRIDWGYLHVLHPKVFLSSYDTRYDYLENKETDKNNESFKREAEENFGIAVISDKASDVICIAYDDVNSVEYFGKPLQAYYKIKYGTFENMLTCAVSDFHEVKVRAEAFQDKLKAQTDKISSNYSDITALAYRQAISAHKLVHNDGVPLFLSKECFSNGCIATLDVTYPSAPLFLKFNPELVVAMLRPIFEYAMSDSWEHPFAPHDCGQYPLCNGQVYGGNKPENQMPVEECGNALITVSAISYYSGDDSFLAEYKELLDKWADYLLTYGYDPENQLCTDDFAGHLAHNCNLGMKSITALGAYGKLTNQKHYSAFAKKIANCWTKEAIKASGSKLSYDDPDSWSLKYNIIWDKLLNLGLFEEYVYKNEIKLYSEKMNKYGMPLDSRSDYTKIDWLAWTAIMTDDKAYIEKLYQALWNFLNETENRVPIADWYYSTTARQVTYNRYIGFQNRTVVGGLFVHLLK